MYLRLNLSSWPRERILNLKLSIFQLKQMFNVSWKHNNRRFTFLQDLTLTFSRTLENLITESLRGMKHIKWDALKYSKSCLAIIRFLVNSFITNYSSFEWNPSLKWSIRLVHLTVRSLVKKNENKEIKNLNFSVWDFFTHFYTQWRYFHVDFKCVCKTDEQLSICHLVNFKHFSWSGESREIIISIWNKMCSLSYFYFAALM